MIRRATITELRWPETPEFVAAASMLRHSIVEDIAAVLWSGYDRLWQEVIQPLGGYAPGDQMERNITQLMVPYMQDVLDGNEPFRVVHGYRENETRVEPPAQQPEYDVGFVFRFNPRSCWPVEAKVLATEGTLAAYLAEIREQYMTCRYGPFSSSGAMLAYVMAGDPVRLLANIEAALGIQMATPSNQFRSRPYRITAHRRAVPPDKSYPADFEVHHFVMPIHV